MEPPIPGPDGFLLPCDDPSREAQLRLNDYLFAEELRSPASPFDLRRWRKLPKGEVADQIAAVLRRLAWLDEHDAELENAHLARMRLTTLLRVLYKIKAPYTEQDLVALLELTAPVLNRVSANGPVELVTEYVQNHDLTPRLCMALRSFQENLPANFSAGLQSLRQQVYMLLWLDEWDALNMSNGWSDGVRRDFRAFSGERRAKWRALLKHIRGNAPVRMPAGWAKSAEPLLAAVGLEDFRQQLQLWFEPFRSGEQQRISMAGSYLIKGLIWYSAVAGEENLRECCLWLLDAKLTPKRHVDKVLGSLAEFGISKEELIVRKVLKLTPPDPLSWLLDRLKGVEELAPAQRIQADPEGDLIVVQGQLHFYRIFRSTGRIERVSDNAELELNWSVVPDRMRVLLHRKCDSQEQVRYRAHLLVQDSVFGQYFVVKL